MAKTLLFYTKFQNKEYHWNPRILPRLVILNLNLYPLKDSCISHKESIRDSIWSLLEEEIAKFAQKAQVILTGDFNARTGSMPDYILHDSRECAHLPPDYIPDYPLASQKTMY